MTLSAVYGPGEVKPQKLLTESATIEVMYKPKVGLPSKKSFFQNFLTVSDVYLFHGDKTKIPLQLQMLLIK